jgi:hypothetical protein
MCGQASFCAWTIHISRRRTKQITQLALLFNLIFCTFASKGPDWRWSCMRGQSTWWRQRGVGSKYMHTYPIYIRIPNSLPLKLAALEGSATCMQLILDSKLQDYFLFSFGFGYNDYYVKCSFLRGCYIYWHGRCTANFLLCSSSPLPSVITTSLYE